MFYLKSSESVVRDDLEASDLGKTVDGGAIHWMDEVELHPVASTHVHWVSWGGFSLQSSWKANNGDERMNCDVNIFSFNYLEGIPSQLCNS